MIRRAGMADKGTAAAIWKACFGDSDDYTEFILGRIWGKAECLFNEIDGVPAAVLYLLPVNLQVSSASLPGIYIYAAATLPEYRRHGLMGELIREAIRKSAKKGMSFTAVLPANESLYDYYAGFGFESTFWLSRADTGRAELEEFSCGSPPLRLIEADGSKMAAQRASCFMPAVLWDEPMFATALAEWRFTGGRIIAAQSGFLLYKKTDEYVFIKELCAKEAEYASFISELLRQTDAGAYRFHLPETGSPFKEGERIRSGMFLPGEGLDGAPNAAYFNLMLD